MEPQGLRLDGAKVLPSRLSLPSYGVFIIYIQITVDPSNALNVSAELVQLTESTDLKPTDLENTVQIVENVAKTLSSLGSQEVTEVRSSFLWSVKAEPPLI